MDVLNGLFQTYASVASYEDRKRYLERRIHPVMVKFSRRLDQFNWTNVDREILRMYLFESYPARQYYWHNECHSFRLVPVLYTILNSVQPSSELTSCLDRVQQYDDSNVLMRMCARHGITHVIVRLLVQRHNCNPLVQNSTGGTSILYVTQTIITDIVCWDSVRALLNKIKKLQYLLQHVSGEDGEFKALQLEDHAGNSALKVICTRNEDPVKESYRQNVLHNQAFFWCVELLQQHNVEVNKDPTFQRVSNADGNSHSQEETQDQDE